MSVETSYNLAVQSRKRELLDRFLEETTTRIEKLAEELESKIESGSEFAPNDPLQKESSWRLREIKDACVGIRVYNREL